MVIVESLLTVGYILSIKSNIYFKIIVKDKQNYEFQHIEIVKS